MSRGERYLFRLLVLKRRGLSRSLCLDLWNVGNERMLDTLENLGDDQLRNLSRLDRGRRP